MVTRRRFLQLSALAGGAVLLPPGILARPAWAEAADEALPGGTLDPTSITKYTRSLVIPPVMPRSGTKTLKGGKNADWYRIAVRQFDQEIVPGLSTTVWGYGSVDAPTDLQLPGVHDRGASGAARWRSSGSTSSSTPTASSCRTCCRSTRRCTGRTRPAARRAATPDRLHRHARPLHRPGADRHPRARCGQRRRRQRRLRGGLVPAGRDQHPGGLRDDGTWYDLFKTRRQSRCGARRGSPARASFRVSERPARRRRSGTTTTRWA